MTTTQRDRINAAWFAKIAKPLNPAPLSPPPTLAWKTLRHGIALCENGFPWRVIVTRRTCPTQKPIYQVGQVKSIDAEGEPTYVLWELKTRVLAKAVALVKERCSIHGGSVPDFPKEAL